MSSFRPNDVRASTKSSITRAKQLIACRVPDYALMKAFRERYELLQAQLDEKEVDYLTVSVAIEQLCTDAVLAIRSAIPPVLFKGAGKFSKKQQIKLIRAMIALHCKPREDRIRRYLTIGELGQAELTAFGSESAALAAIDELYSALQAFNDDLDRRENSRRSRRILYGEDTAHVGRKRGKAKYLRT